MSNISGEILLSKIIEEGSALGLKRHNVKRSDFQTKVEQQTYDFITTYEAQYGEAPSFTATIQAVPEFNPYTNVTDSLEYLAKKLKEKKLHAEAEQYLTQEALPNWGKVASAEWIDDTFKKLKEIKEANTYGEKVGHDVATDFDDFLAEYEDRKAGKSNRIFKSSFKSMNDAVTGYIAGNMYVWYARSGRGKSYITTLEVLFAAIYEGATVLIWALEMSKFEWLARAYSIMSAFEKLIKQKVNGAEYLAGFKSNELINGKLDEEHEERFKLFLATLNEVITGRIIIRGKTDRDFNDRTADALESDILKVGADIALIDPFYLMDYEANRDRTTGGAASATSQRLVRLAGTTDCVIHAITQAEEIKNDKDDDGARVLQVPERSEVLKTQALLQDAFLLIGLDTCDGRFQVSLNKGRQGGEGVTFEGVFLPQVGYVREPQIEEVKAQLNHIEIDLGDM
ncbi:DnaB-like helicase C-terminal domain-containing protein [Bacillus cereus]|uniref:DnaB-like helicase C-terminal domain-containing protein n=1 Tax=Bacillus cereus group TaxID=86661 RepID=UPI001BA51F7B|nr:DnaB-like helicase C-terminal domain-containing protein [Bacillus cereus]MBR9655774.1 DNA helicase [Bacillus cereus]